MSKHRSSIDHMNRSGGASAMKSGSGMRSGGSAGGSMGFKENTPQSKSPSMGGSSDSKALGRAARGKIETMRGKNVS